MTLGIFHFYNRDNNPWLIFSHLSTAPPRLGPIARADTLRTTAEAGFNGVPAKKAAVRAVVSRALCWGGVIDISQTKKGGGSPGFSPLRDGWGDNSHRGASRQRQGGHHQGRHFKNCLRNVFYTDGRVR